MLSVLVATVALCAQQTSTLELTRGKELSGQGGRTFRYWGVEDTFLNSDSPNENYGGTAYLQGGPGRTILIKFGDLERAIGPNKRIKSAKLVLTIYSSGKPQIRTVGRVLVPWGEGPSQKLAVLQTKGEQETPPWSSTWKQRRSGPNGAPWMEGGANGSMDVSTISSAKIEESGPDELTIGGLGGTFQAMYERWYENNGIAINLDSRAEFESSQSNQKRPRLVLELEDVAPVSGPDLSVSVIERSPEYARADLTGGTTSKPYQGQEIAVADHIVNSGTPKWPADGDDLTYTAHIKNVGSVVSQGFSGTWFVSERSSIGYESDKLIAPGEEVTVQFHKPFKTVLGDHRTVPIAFVIKPKGPDSNPGNNALQVNESALNVGVSIAKSAYDSLRSKGIIFEDWVQSQVRTLNGVLFPNSRFSFAPDGVLERVRVQRIDISDAKPAQSLMYDAQVRFDEAQLPETRDFLRNLSEKLRLVSLSPMQVHAGDNIKIPISRGMVDRFPGMMGGGDTRNDSQFPPQFCLPGEPVPDSIADLTPAEATDLLSATDVGGWNSNVGHRSAIAGDYLYDVPSLVMVRARDFQGNPIVNAELAFFQSSRGVIADEPPVFSVLTNSSGTILLPNRDTMTDGPFTTITGHSLKPNPFGRIDTAGGNGTFLVKCSANGVTEWGWLKLEQLVDAYRRGNKSLAILDIRFNIPTMPLELTGDLSKNKIITDSHSTPVAILAPLLDGVGASEVSIGNKAGDWIEIDLGRDRVVGEIRLFAKSTNVWKRFEITAYATGQDPKDSNMFARELDGVWSFENRRDIDAKNPEVISVAYRGPAQRVRFIRLINRADVASAKLTQIRVVPAIAQ